MKKNAISNLFIFILSVISVSVSAQKQLTQTVRGVVVDANTGTTLPYISVGVVDMPEMGVMTDSLGNFVLRNIPIGRHSFKATSINYHPYLISEILVTSSKEVFLEIPLKESTNELAEIVVNAHSNDDVPLNKMTLVGGRMLRVEQASRYAGGLDDRS